MFTQFLGKNSCSWFIASLAGDFLRERDFVAVNSTLCFSQIREIQVRFFIQSDIFFQIILVQYNLHAILFVSLFIINIKY